MKTELQVAVGPGSKVSLVVFGVPALFWRLAVRLVFSVYVA